MKYIFRIKKWFLLTLIIQLLLPFIAGCSQKKYSDEKESRHTPDDTSSEPNPLSVPLLQQTISLRGNLSVPAANTKFTQEELVAQLSNYDPGHLLRCDLNDNEKYHDAVEALGGVRWDYHVSLLEDQSMPLFKAGIEIQENDTLDSAGSLDLEIVEADIVGLSEEAALFASKQHGLFLVDLSNDTPKFVCAAKLPGETSKFYYHNNRLVVISEPNNPDGNAWLLHFEVSSNSLSFIEAIDLKARNVLDSRRFNERLVIYTNMAADKDALEENSRLRYFSDDRRLMVLNWGETLKEELSETYISDIEDINEDVTPETHSAGDLVKEYSFFNENIWASNRYFVITEGITQSYLRGFEQRSLSRCVESHTLSVPYTHCYTVYETRPNPNYEPPDNTGGDRSCSGTTLGSCLRHVATVSNKTIEVPVETICEERTRTQFICNRYETTYYTVPVYDEERSTRLFIYEYTQDGFIRLESEVAQIENNNLESVLLSDSVESLTTSSEKYELQIEGYIQNLYFQNDFLYVIADGILQVYAMGENSLIRTSTLNVIGDRHQSSLFTNNTIYLSDFAVGSANDTSLLKLIDLSNPAFPTIMAQTPRLPGGHSHILAIDEGVFTIGKVRTFEGESVNHIKLGLFGSTTATELSYLFLGTDLDYNNISGERDFYFDNAEKRLFLPYNGWTPGLFMNMYRIGISNIRNQEILSEGALETNEEILRIRQEPFSGRIFGFGNSSINSIVANSNGWALEEILEYYTPVFLYRYSDNDDYVEVMNLGNKCRLRFANANKINERNNYSEPFPCSVWYTIGRFLNTASVWAYGNNLIFSETIGFSFNAEGKTESLTENEITALREARSQRPVCLLSTETRLSTTESVIDFNNSDYSIEDFTCMSPEKHLELLKNQDTP